jgi:hypothetical protein
MNAALSFQTIGEAYHIDKPIDTFQIHTSGCCSKYSWITC